MKISFLCLSALSFSLIACGGPSKEDLAVQKLKDKKLPGYVRILNLGTIDLTLMHKGRTLGTASPSTAWMKAGAVPEGEQTLKVMDGQKELFQVPMKVGPDEVKTIVVRGNGSHFLIEGELRKPTEEANVAVVVVDSEGKPVASAPTFTVKGLLGPVKLTANSKVRLNNGDWVTAGGPVSGKAEMKIEEKLAYSFIYLQMGGSYKPFFLLNTPNEKPISAGAG